MGLWEYHLETRSVSFDERWRNIFGVSAASQIGYDELAARFHSDDRETNGEALKRALADGSDGIYEREYRSSGRTVRCIGWHPTDGPSSRERA